jgi:hypothetical protein
MRTQFGQIHDAVTKAGGDMADPSDLRVDEARTDPAAWLRQHGWSVTVVGVHELMASYHREPPADLADAIWPCEFICGQRPAAGSASR